MKTFFVRTLTSLTFVVATAPAFAASNPTPAPCGSLPAVFDVASLSYTSPQVAGDYEVTLTFPSLKNALCTKKVIGNSAYFNFDFENTAELPRISVRNSQGVETQSRTFGRVRVIHQEESSGLSLLKAYPAMSDLDILTFFPREDVIKENLERGGSQAGRPVRVSIR